MKLQLLLSRQTDNYLETRDIWQQACRQLELPLEIVDLEDPVGENLAENLNIRSFPVLLVDGMIKAVGRPKSGDAITLLQSLIKPGSKQE